MFKCRMILDGIIGLFGALIEGAAALCVALVEVIPLMVNAGAVMVEFVVGLFVSGFSLGRIHSALSRGGA